MVDKNDKTEIAKAAVIYTDGGCRYNGSKTNTNCIGFGAHGYIHELIESKPNKAENWYVTSDGYKKTNDNPGHLNVMPVEYIDMIGASTSNETNNRAELKAVITILQRLKDHDLTKILIQTDSDYVNKGVNEWLPNWSSRDFIKNDGTEVINSDLWKELEQALASCDDKNIDVTLRWIKAHNGDLGNEEADSLATIGNNISLSGINQIDFTVTDPKGYWKPTVIKNPLLGFKRIYFNSLPEYNKPGSYYQADPGVKDQLIGKRVPEASYSVIRLKEPDVLLEEVIKKQYEVTKIPNTESYYNGIFLVKVDVVYGEKVLKNLIKFGSKALSSVSKSYNINSPSNENVTVELNPTGLCMRAINNFTLLEQLLDKYLGSNSEDIDSLGVNLIDVTDTFYATVEKKKKTVLQLHKSVNSTNRDLVLSLHVHGKEIAFPVSLGKDLLDRNSLKKLEVHNPKIQLVTWLASETVVKYGFIIECDLGVGIWSNYFSDTIYL